ncbi:hypothetical protein J3Q64DRAFT_1694633 [Phycomyces blakesleeanus]|uniref:Uncharacterized protein n=2 Tax=Phycomyces blakesleeanus TaxID=4837 RepID=A0A167QR86_PHYB8|nr:hypothetical protein PHYBLDRAFT_59167 [Phycomyces blakesleeanus NRRL 1555(-)]OAD80120.1 hypothetical protein PHYBLDRAFT_59167 [Phycomyces blakesleeanus NRRL 1555(-)]|eukprot:XP_018298160.1 hypothetical protein PHYBLDRAFT_59167 [Phycomyces blakesleeanus NRRL 1555(-)]
MYVECEYEMYAVCKYEGKKMCISSNARLHMYQSQEVSHKTLQDLKKSYKLLVSKKLESFDMLNLEISESKARCLVLVYYIILEFLTIVLQMVLPKSGDISERKL